MSTTGNAVLDDIEEAVEDIAVTVSGIFGAVTVGNTDDNANEVGTPRRTHVVPVGDRKDTDGGGCCTRILTLDIVGFWPRTPLGIRQMMADVIPYEAKLRRIDNALAALTPPNADTRWPRLIRGAEFAYGDFATATWRLELYYTTAGGA